MNAPEISPEEADATKPGRPLWLRLLVLAALATAGGAGLFYYRTHFHDPAEAARAIITGFRGLGAWGPLAFIVIYVVTTLCFVPATLFTLAAGPLFGLGWGTLIVVIASNLSAMGAFLLSRSLLGDWVRARTGKRLQKLNDGIADGGWRFVALTRLVPLFPFTPLNYALGLTPISFTAASLTSAICMLPATFAYVYLGYALANAASGGAGDLKHSLSLIFGAIALIALIALLPGWLKKRQAHKAAQLKSMRPDLP